MKLFCADLRLIDTFSQEYFLLILFFYFLFLRDLCFTGFLLKTFSFLLEQVPGGAKFTNP